jgi:hypothetical protein
MIDYESADTSAGSAVPGGASLGAETNQPTSIRDFGRSILRAAFVTELLRATGRGIQPSLREESAATDPIASALTESSTRLHRIAPATRAKFQAILDAARHDIIEDGMSNTITEKLPLLINKDLDTVIPALVAAIEAGETTPIIAAEILKTVGRPGPASHATRRWLLERALKIASPVIRDGAGLGLARMGDPGAIPYLRRAIAAECSPETRQDLQAVVNELIGIANENGISVAEGE